MTISIGIPAYNAARFLRLTLDSVRAQTFTDWEVVVVDDGSKDETAQIAREYAALDSRIRLEQQANSGLSATRNRALAAFALESEFVIFLDADDVWEKDTLEVLHAALQADPAALGAYGLARYINAEGQPFRIGYMEDWSRQRLRVFEGRPVPCALDEPTTFAVLAVRNVIATSGAMLLRRAPLEALGPAFCDVTLPSCEDYDLWLRLTRSGHFRLVNKLVLGYRQHGANMTGKGRVMDRTEIQVRRKLIASPETTPEQRRIARLGYRFKQRAEFYKRLGVTRDFLSEKRFAPAAAELRRSLRSFYRSLRGLPSA